MLTLRQSMFTRISPATQGYSLLDLARTEKKGLSFSLRDYLSRLGDKEAILWVEARAAGSFFKNYQTDQSVDSFKRADPPSREDLVAFSAVLGKYGWNLVRVASDYKTLAIRGPFEAAFNLPVIIVLLPHKSANPSGPGLNLLEEGMPDPQQVLTGAGTVASAVGLTTDAIGGVRAGIAAGSFSTAEGAILLSGGIATGAAEAFLIGMGGGILYSQFTGPGQADITVESITITSQLPANYVNGGEYTIYGSTPVNVVEVGETTIVGSDSGSGSITIPDGPVNPGDPGSLPDPTPVTGSGSPTEPDDPSSDVPPC